MISKFKFLLLTALTLPLVLSCGKEGGSNEGPSRPDSAISVNPTSLTLRQEGETQRVSVKASGKWAINGSEPWLQISPDTSDGDEIISITAGENPDTDERNATLTLICGDASAKLTVIQKQKDALTVTSNKQEVEAVGGTVDIEIKSNVEYTIEIDSACKDWISQTGTKSMLTTHVILDVAQNMDFEKREGKVTIRSGSLSEVVTIYQDGSEPVIVISQSEYTLPASESELKIEIKSNVEVSAAIQQGVDWISRNETKSVSTSTFHYSVMANISEEPRSAEIIFSNSECNLRDVVKVTQLPKSAIVVAKTSYEIDSNGGTLTFPVQHNTEYLVDISETWVKREQTKAMQTTNEVFTVEANTSYDSRTATITFTSSDNAVRQVVTLTQEQLDIVLPEKENIEIKGEGGNFDVKLQTNAQYTVEISDETWIHQITEQTKSLVSNTLHFTADANTTGEDRTGWIRIKIYGSDEVVAIKVSQPAVETAQSNSIYNVGPEGGYVNVNLVTNIPFYTLEITPAEASYWLEQVSTKSTRTDVLTFNVAKNIEYESREATVKVKSNSTSAVVTSFVIKQNPQPIPGNVIIYTTKYDYELSLKVTTGYGANLMENTYKDGLGKLVFDDDVKTIPANAFSGLNTLTSIILPNCTWSIGSKAFYNCASMIDLTIPESVTTIASDAFSGCTGTLHCNCNSIEVGGSFSAVEIGANVTSMPVLRCNYDMQNVVFLNPDNIKDIPAKCFQDCRALETIVLPPNIETIGEQAFQNCYALKALTIPDKVKKIEQSTFSNCSELETVTFPSGFTSIGDGAFASSGIKYITIPANVTSLGKQCFMSCRNLQTLTFEKGSKLSTITGGYSSGTPYGAFYDCSALKNVTIPANVNTIAASAFGECTALESVTVESGGKLKYIEGGYYDGPYLSSRRQYYGAFYGCSALKSVNLGSSLSSIGRYAFYKCYNLKSVTIMSSNAPSLPNSDYTPFSTSGATLNVPTDKEWSYSCKGFHRYFSNLPYISYSSLTLDGYLSSTANFTGGMTARNALGGESFQVMIYCNTSEYSTSGAKSAVVENCKCTVTGLKPNTKYYYWQSCKITYNGSTYTWDNSSSYYFTTYSSDNDGDNESVIEKDWTK